jgi:hypothetical protein
MTNLSDLFPAGAGKQVSFVADGAISAAGKPVVLTALGKVAQVAESTAAADVPYGSASEVDDTPAYATNYGSIATDPFNTGRVVASITVGGATVPGIRIGTTSGSTITWGTEIVVNSETNEYPPIVCFDPNNENQILLAYVGTVSSREYVVTSATITGTSSITLGTPVAFTGTGDWYQLKGGMLAFDGNNTSTPTFAMVYVSKDGNGRWYNRAGTISGNAITLGTEDLVNSGQNWNSNDYAIDYNTTGTFVCTGTDGSSPYTFAYAGTVSGTTITRGTIVTFYSAGSDPGNPACDPNAPTKFIYAWGESSTVAKMNVGTLSGTGDRTITAGTSVSISGGDHWLYFINKFNPATTGEFFLNFKDDVANIYKTAICSYTGTTPTVGTPATLINNGTRDQWAACDISSGAWYTILNNTTTSDIEVILGKFESQETNLTATNFIGISDAAILDTASGNVTIKGGIAVTGLSSLTPGSDYYAQTDGTISTSSSGDAVKIGKAMSATSINLEYQS